MTGRMNGHGAVALGAAVEVRNVVPPVETAEWDRLMADRERMTARVLNLYSPSELMNLLDQQLVSMYEIWVTGATDAAVGEPERVGSQCLELLSHGGKDYVNVIWLSVEAGRFSPAVRAAIQASWKQIAEATGIRRWLLSGRPGWEHILRVNGVEPREVSRLWHFDVGRL